MKRISPHFWVALGSALAVLGLAVVDLRGASSGELSMVHQSVPELNGSSGCDECHGGWFESMSEACLDCHEPIEQQLEGGFGLHGTIDATQVDACSLCHSEHHGPTFQPTNVQSFVLAVSTTLEEFDHAVIGWEMDGPHLELACVECHENADAAPLSAGQRRFLGLDRDCASCHDDPHEGALAAVSCADCHLQQGFDALTFRDHERVLHLGGGHADVDCRSCHGEGEVHALERVLARDAAPARDCLECHDSPHRGKFVGAFADSIGSTRGSSCVDCHGAEHETFRDEELTLTPKVHAFSGFELVRPHADLECGQCHAPEERRFRDRYPKREADDCAACHEDPHGGQFDQGPFAEKGCIACHERRRFEPHAFGVAKHGRTGLELSGAHLEADCRVCHVDPEPDQPRLFEGLDARCESCHSDAHAGFFDLALARLASVVESPEDAPPGELHANGDCALCHLSTRFDDVPEESFDHYAWTGFPVDGAHTQGGCETCHLPEPRVDRHGRVFGRVSDTFGTFQGCDSCHSDPHDGRFDFAQLPREVEGRAGCARCHGQSSFRVLEMDFDHAQWTGFELAGKHGEVGCAACHAPMHGEPQHLASGVVLSGRSFAPAQGTSCVDCHRSPHGDQFDTGIPVTCESCHSGARGFNDLVFHHDRDTRFRLGEAHRDLECAACHEAEVQTGTSVVRYRGLGRECTDCHGVHTDQLKRGRRKDG